MSSCGQLLIVFLLLGLAISCGPGIPLFPLAPVTTEAVSNDHRDQITLSDPDPTYIDSGTARFILSYPSTPTTAPTIRTVTVHNSGTALSIINSVATNSLSQTEYIISLDILSGDGTTTLSLLYNGATINFTDQILNIDNTPPSPPTDVTSNGTPNTALTEVIFTPPVESSDISYYLVTLCTNRGCSTGCLDFLEADGSYSAIFENITAGNYYLCAQSVDHTGLASDFASSANRMPIRAP